MSRCYGLLRPVGVRAYVLKGHVRREFLDTIRAVHACQKRIPPEIAVELADAAADEELTSRWR